MYIKVTLLGFALISNSVLATTTFTINQGGLRDSIGGTATNGMSWGLLFDVDGDGFLLGSYDGFDISSNYFELTAGGVGTGDVFIFAGDETSSTPPTTTQFGPNAGTVTSVLNVQYDGPNSSPSLNSAVGNSFGVIWFPSNTAIAGSSYGFASNADMVNGIPNDGSNFSTTDAIAPLDPSYTTTPVPEPSAYAALLGVAAILYVNRRRRK